MPRAPRPVSALSPRKRPQQERALATVEAILLATAHILVERGIDGLTTNKVAERAGVSIGSLYQYFPSKDALLAALAARHAEQMQSVLGAALADLAAVRDADGVVAVVDGLIGAMLDAHALDPALHRVLASGHDPLQGLERSARDLVATALRALGDVVVVVDVDVAAFVLVTVVEAAAHRAVAEGALDDVARGALRRELVALIARYLLPNPALAGPPALR